MTSRFVGALGVLIAITLGCGGSKDVKSPTEVKGVSSTDAIDADPVVLLPSAPVLVGTFDVRGMVDQKGSGAQLATLLEQTFPIGAEASFSVSRDVDRVTFASYQTQGLDVVAVLSGRFDADKLAQAAKAHTPTKGGGLIVESTYTDRTLYTVDNIGFTVMSPKTVLCGTENAMRRALERVKDGRLKRAFFPWVMETLDTKGAAFAIVADLANQPVQPVSLGFVAITFVQGLKAARVLGDFQPPGLHVAGTATYDTEDNANAGAQNMTKLGGMANAFAKMSANVPQLRDLKIEPKKTDIQVSFAVDDASLRDFLTKTAPQLF